MQQKALWCYLIMLCWAVMPINLVIAAQPLSENKPVAKYDNAPLDLEMLKDSNSARHSSKIITAETIEKFSRFRSTMPSLWWTQDQLDRQQKLVSNWLVYPEQKRIDLVVNQQLWNNLEYIQRYHFINRYGTAARQYGYNVRIFNLRFSETKPIVAYTCTYGTTPLMCHIQWQEVSQRSIRVNSSR